MKKAVILVVLLALLFNFLVHIVPLFFDKQASLVLRGPGSTAGIFFQILAQFRIIIDSPENITYNFTIQDYLSNNLVIDLNVSSNREVDIWQYTLEDLRHNKTVNNSIVFTPNITVNFVRWNNKITVFANDSDGNVVNSSVEFFVFVPNIAPILNISDNELLRCEGESLLYGFNATDSDEDGLTFDHEPKSDPFSVRFNPLSEIIIPGTPSLLIAENEISSGTLLKQHAKDPSGGAGIKYQKTILVKDNFNDSCCSDNKKINITVIEINNKPSAEDIGIHTVYTRGENSTLFEIWNVDDIEDGNQDLGNLSFNISFENSANLFSITQNGTMSYIGNVLDAGAYNITVCVSDLGIPIPRRHQNISLCGQDGSNLSSCDFFQIVVTDENRYPEVLSHFPETLIVSVLGTDSSYFNISKKDPDGGVPDTYWYVDNNLVEYDGNASFVDEFIFSFGCEVEGLHTIKAEITDGLLNDSVQWNVSVGFEECPVPPPGGGGGGGGGGKICHPKWSCLDWNVCQKAVQSLASGELSGENYRIINAKCLENNWDDEICGFQTRECNDINNCNRETDKPNGIQECYYTINPTCFDGIKNCHSNSCEFLVDCGGPCKACPTCSDNIKNQGEEGVDCGGACPLICPKETPLRTRIYYALGFILILLILLLAYIAYKVINLRKKL